jgi:hypothetical protein
MLTPARSLRLLAATLPPLQAADTFADELCNVCCALCQAGTDAARGLARLLLGNMVRAVSEATGSANANNVSAATTLPRPSAIIARDATGCFF